MKLKHWLSLAGSLLFAWQGKAQQPSVKKETAPQSKSPLPSTSLQKDGKMLPDKAQKYNKARPDKALPLAVKPGEFVFATRFEQEVDGDMPGGWITDGNGAVAKIVGQEGRWLRIDENTNYELRQPLSLPDNFTLSFDFLANYKDDQTVPELAVRLFRKGTAYAEPGVLLHLSPNGGTTDEATRIQLVAQDENGSETFRSAARTLTNFQRKNGKNQPVHVVLSVRGDRLKALVDGEKVYDLAELWPAGVKFDRLGFTTTNYGGPRNNYDYYLSNISIKAD